MTPFNIALLFCRLLSIWCVARFAESFGQAAAQAFVMSAVLNPQTKIVPLHVIAYAASWPLGLIVVASVLWIGAPLIARNVTSDIEYSKRTPQANTSLFAIGQGLLGMFLIARGLSGVVAGLVSIFLDASGQMSQFRPQYQGESASALVNLLIGLCLVFVARNAMRRESNLPRHASSQDENTNGSL